MPHHPRARRLASVAIAAAWVLSACNPPAPTAAPTAAPTSSPRPAAEVYAEIREDVAAIRGLEPTAAVDPVTIDEAQLRQNLEAEFDAEQTPAELSASEDVLAALGLLADGASLRELTLDFQAGQVAGYYSPERDQLFVVSRSGALGPAEEVTYAHEFTHQLQDQHINLDTVGIGVASQRDQSLARLALIEGDAVTVQSLWTEANLTPQELGQLLASSLDPVALEALRRAPAFLRETSLFPYQDGLAFVSRLMASGGFAAVDAAYDDPPDSTEQVLHPDRYLVREPPIQVGLPAGLAATLGTGWAEAGRDTLGELVLRIWLREGGVPIAEARTAAAGWGGDRLVLLRGPNAAITMGLVSEWDTEADAREFADAAESAIQGLALVAHVWLIPGTSRVVVTFGEWYSQLGAALGA